jgi:hypothetical protein
MRERAEMLFSLARVRPRGEAGREWTVTKKMQELQPLCWGEMWVGEEEEGVRHILLPETSGEKRRVRAARDEGGWEVRRWDSQVAFLERLEDQDGDPREVPSQGDTRTSELPSLGDEFGDCVFDDLWILLLLLVFSTLLLSFFFEACLEGRLLGNVTLSLMMPQDLCHEWSRGGDVSPREEDSWVRAVRGRDWERERRGGAEGCQFLPNDLEWSLWAWGETESDERSCLRVRWGSLTISSEALDFGTLIQVESEDDRPHPVGMAEERRFQGGREFEESLPERDDEIVEMSSQVLWRKDWGGVNEKQEEVSESVLLRGRGGKGRQGQERQERVSQTFNKPSSSRSSSSSRGVAKSFVCFSLTKETRSWLRTWRQSKKWVTKRRRGDAAVSVSWSGEDGRR